MRILTLLIIFLFISNVKTYSQTNYYQDIFFGGITGSGFSPSYTGGPFSGNIQLASIPSGSTIRKAILFASRIGHAPPINLMFNGNTFTIDNNSLVTQPFNSPVFGDESGIHSIDVTNFVSTSQNSYSISCASFQNTSSNRFSDFYLLVTFDNTALNKVACSILLNDQDFGPVIIYNPIAINPIDPMFDIGLSLSSGYICDNLNDGERAFVNNVNIGDFGGHNPNSGECGGPFGNFLYENGIFSGFNGSDPQLGFNSYNVIKTINTLLISNNSIDLRYESLNSNPQNSSSNSIWINKLLYSTSCDTFPISMPTDITTCKNENYQINVNGGQAFDWFPEVGLSCYDCPNPVFLGDSTMNYTIQIWNNDSCSVVRNMRINVEDCADLKELNKSSKKHIKTIDIMGRETEDLPNVLLIYIYSDGTTEKVIRIEQ